MRELKFRAWNKRYDEMIYPDDGPYLFELDNQGITVRDTEMETYLQDNSCCYEKYHVDVDIMQYTGLKDRNGVEIYEGDIVEYTASMFGVTEYKKTGKVEFYDSTYMLNDGQNSREWLDKENVNEWKIEVIGNIYKNPEWLEVE